MESAPETNTGRRGERGGGSVAWTAAAVLTVVACIVFMAADGGRVTSPSVVEGPAPGGPPKLAENPERMPKFSPTADSGSPAVSGPVRSKPPRPTELAVARQRLEELSKTYLPEAPAYRAQLARVQALERIEREHANDSRELKAVRVDLEVAIARGLGGSHPKVVALKARIDELEKLVANGD